MNHLQLVALGLGGLGLAGGAWALRSPETAQRFWRELPRNQTLGRFLMLVNVVWALFLFHKMKLGDWDWIKRVVYVSSPLIYWLIIRQANHYLGARSVALFLILAAKPVVNICFLRDESSRLVITTLAYLWVAAGICIVAVPHWMRDLIAFFQASPERWRRSCQIKIAASLTLIALAFFVY